MHRVIPPLFHTIDCKPEKFTSRYNLVCMAKWAKRPFKRFPLIAEAFTLLNQREKYKDAKLHVFGWLLGDSPMPYTTGIFPAVSVSRRAKSNSNIVYYHKGFQGPRDAYLECLRNSDLLIHLSAVDSGANDCTRSVFPKLPSFDIK